MGDDDRLARRFEEHRPRLTAVARRMLGSADEAEDAVQEAWILLSRQDSGSIDELGSWLTTVVARVCLSMLRSRRAHPEVPLADDLAGPVIPDAAPGPAEEALLADTVGLALLVVLDTLGPAERVAFVLHDMFGVPFDEIAPVLGRNPAAARQLASRARRRVRGADPSELGDDRVRHAGVVDAFLAAARAGDFERLLALLDPDVELRADDATVRMGVPALMRGREQVRGVVRMARGATPALIGGDAAVVWLVGGRPRVVWRFTTAGDRITGIELIGEPGRIAALDLVIAGD
ncbi:MAG: sigma-70 family RNA polymerase sigma factor [Thermoleophilia bacterium]